MLPNELTSDSFRGYPPQARELANRNLDLLKQLPLAFVPLLLRELIAYDWMFPAERSDLEFQFSYLKQADVAKLMQPFRELQVSAELTKVDWVNVPADFSERLSAHLWATHQIDAFRTASVEYVHSLNAAKPTLANKLPRLAIVLVGHDATAAQARFRKVKQYGVHYTSVDPQPVPKLIDFIAARAEANPEPFAHWYIDGDKCLSTPASLTCVSYSALDPIRQALLNKMTKTMAPGGGGPELLRSQLQRLTPDSLGVHVTGDAVLSRFELSLLTEGSGTQIFSTSFVQWAAREALRRAQPSTLMARFTPRRREAKIGAPVSQREDLDPDGSLIDGEMGAYYTWINQERLPGADQSRFVVWYENHNQAVVIAPSLKPGTEQSRSISVADLVANLS